MTPNAYRPFRRLAALVAVAGLLSLTAGQLSAQRDSAVPGKPDVKTITHVLNRVGFGARPGDVERVQQTGLAAYIDQQLHPERVANAAMDARLAEFETLTMDARDLGEKFAAADQMRRELQRQQAQQAPPPVTGDPTMTAPPATPPRQPPPPELRMLQQQAQNITQELMQAKILRAAMSERQLEEVLVDFWFNHFNVFIGKGQVRQYLTDYEQNVIRPHVFGSFRDLLGATAHSPAMLFYLDNFQSSSPNAAVMISPEMERRLNDPRLRPEQRRQLMQRLEQMRRPQQQRPQRGLNENYARELMELHTLGVDGGYTQKDVIEVARALTGWTIDQPRMGGSFLFRSQTHDATEKVILGAHFPKGGGQEEGERVLDMLAKHPSTARHISFKLAQRFVSDEPPKALVDRAARKFLDTKGDLREVTRVIITSPEFFAAEAYRAKVKTPFEFVVSAIRASGATVVNAQPLVQAMQQLGMPLYGCQPPTGYSMTADAWVNTGALLNRMNFAVSLVNGGQGLGGGRGGRPGQPGQPGQPGAPPNVVGPLGQPGAPAGQLPPNPRPRPNQPQGGLGQPLRPAQMARMPLQLDMASLAPDTSEATLEKLIQTILTGQVADTTRQTLARAESPQQLVALALGSPEFQRR
ncbi:MAG TPA: DUF1800 domain-containing protein [Vicinamibacterales bacterium]|nr:DUF1800 domain-containing protein [Vicinamibacterales bacterium]